MNVKQLKDKDGNAIQPNAPDKVGYFSSTATKLSWGVDNPIDQDGWVSIYGRFTVRDSVYMVINGVIVCENGTDNATTIGIAHSTYPVKKGDTVKAVGNTTSGAHPNVLYFYPNRTNLENGGGGSLTP